jgi:copper oxidase (laccase) domain-containing protein
MFLMTGASCYLDGLLGQPDWRAAFVGRVPGVEVTRDKWETLRALEPAHAGAVRGVGFGWENLWRAEQVHGAELAVVPGAGVGGRPVAEADRIVAGVDGLLTGQAGVLLGIYVADCAAVYLADRRTGAAGLVHSGRQGTEGGIVPRAIRRMGEEFGTRPEDVVAVVSPCIRPPRYEVDIAGEIVRQLRAAGVPGEQVTDSGICTGADVEHYYSYRVEKGKTGRMLALLGRIGEERPRDEG